MGRAYRRFSYHDATYRISEKAFALAKRSIIAARNEIERYCASHPVFLTTLEPLAADPDAPEIVRRMIEGSGLCGVGPMASVAGAIAEEATRYACAHGVEEAIVENGGDLSIVCTTPVLVAVEHSEHIRSTLAFRILPEHTPLAICSSSSSMGHSLSFGNCDLATVVSRNASIADAAATAACNMVKTIEDIEPTLNYISSITGVDGVLIAKGETIGLVGDLPELVRHEDPDIGIKITRTGLG